MNFRNVVVESDTMMTLKELCDLARSHGVPTDAVLIFREDRRDAKTDRNIVDILQIEKHGGLTYLTLGGHL